ncbi:MAG: hypothetical protein IKU14_00890 [Rhodocyclaceae bacterium]|nr:hypothetical protein [Rhodocyclaceae bacterium]
MTAAATIPAIERPLPKSYLTDAERERRMTEDPSGDSLFLAESGAAREAEDFDAMWSWMARAKLPAPTLRFLRWRRGSDFIREFGFDTTLADQEFGEDWLDKEDPLFKRWKA